MLLALILSLSFTSFGLQARDSDELVQKELFNGYESIKYKVYSPKNIKEKAPLILYLHGCTQDADIFFDSTRIKKYADLYQFKVLLPIQPKIKNPFKCWKWFTKKSTSKFGETLLLANLVDQVIVDQQIDPNKVFVAGFSAGAAMSNVLVNCYPEKFSAMAAHDGAAYSSVTYTNPLMSIITGSGISPEASAKKGYLCANQGKGYTKAPYDKKKMQMPSLFFHSDASIAMPRKFSETSLAQLMNFNDLLDNGILDQSLLLIKTQTSVLKNQDGRESHAYTKIEYTNESGQLFFGLTLVHGQDHNWSGGDETYPFNDAKGPNATKEIVEFFRVWGL